MTGSEPLTAFEAERQEINEHQEAGDVIGSAVAKRSVVQEAAEDMPGGVVTELSEQICQTRDSCVLLEPANRLNMISARVIKLHGATGHNDGPDQVQCQQEEERTVMKRRNSATGLSESLDC